MEDGAIRRMIDETRTLDLKLEFFPFTAMDIIHTYVSNLDGKYAKWSSKYAEIHVFSGCEQIHSKYTVKYTG